MPHLVTVIGDLVGSRRAPDRARLQDALGRSLSVVNATVAAVQAFEPTVGDEFQGGCQTLADATMATLLVRLAMRGHADVRCGIGQGEVTVHDPGRAPLLQDGPGWWTAREALERVAAPRHGGRTWYVGPDDPPTVNAFLLCRDTVVSRLNDRGASMLQHALQGHSQREIAELEGVSASAVSQQFSRGISTVVEAQRLLAAARA
jgi:DNA-binding CsgD family transcriptional regulator